MTDERPGVAAFRPDQLAGFRIGVTSDRRSADLIDAFERRGASVLHAPTVHMRHADDDAPVIADTERIIAARPDVLLATTSYGMRRWFEVSDSAGLGEDLQEVLAGSTILVRGPKARGAVRAAGLDDAGMSDEETTASLVGKVIAEFPSGITVAVQLHGSTDEDQLQRLRDAGDDVITVAPYSWSVATDDDERATRLIDAIAGRHLDCVTFTSAPAVDGLFIAALARGRHAEVVEALRTDVVAAGVGPVTTGPLVAAGIEPLQPDRFRMGALIRLVCEHLEARSTRRVSTRHGDVELRGSLAIVDGTPVRLTPASLSLFRALVAANGAVVSRRELSIALDGGGDEHAMEVSLSRLRQVLGRPGLVSTVVKRGYRLDV
ncbi:uroporphyrinogen-III synthase [Leifsonia shinshuensis]|uniref:uroporphyrinogen-III synthase n=1 Tax=Leifsonia shinshuensis TaxID=150026 RepID=UPI00285FD89A|nr:uroporphyrinogen-III synthase [Leifsonia shinshuensis]MDR6972068.1 uroporphyrinogen-III synthase [Leifsonia shinshuensis]